MSIRLANRPVTDEQGYVTGTLLSIEETTIQRSNPDPETGEIKTQEQYCFTFGCEGRTGPINIKLWTGRNIDDTPDDQGRYNKLTTILLKTGLLTEAELKTPDKIDLSELSDRFLALAGQDIRFRVTKAGRFHEVDISSLELISE